MAHTTYSEIVAQLMQSEPIAGSRTVTVELAEGETAWRPDSTKSDLAGPGVWSYTRHSDGGFTCRREPCTVFVGEIPCFRPAIRLVRDGAKWSTRCDVHA